MCESTFIERRFQLGNRYLLVRFSAPSQMPTGEFQCRSTTLWPDEEVHRETYGEDGVQALLLAMRVVHSGLVASDAYKEGRLTLFGDPALDLFGDSALELSFPPARE